MCFLSRPVKLDEVFRTVISCLELKIAILRKFIELHGFTIPEQLLFQAFISCAQHQQDCYKCLNFAFVMELAWQEATKSSCFFLDRFFAGEGPTAPRVVQAVLVSLCWAGFAQEGVWCVLGSGGVRAGTAEVMYIPVDEPRVSKKGLLPASLLLSYSILDLFHASLL